MERGQQTLILQSDNGQLPVMQWSLVNLLDQLYKVQGHLFNDRVPFMLHKLQSTYAIINIQMVQDNNTSVKYNKIRINEIKKHCKFCHYLTNSLSPCECIQLYPLLPLNVIWVLLKLTYEICIFESHNWELKIAESLSIFQLFVKEGLKKRKKKRKIPPPLQLLFSIAQRKAIEKLGTLAIDGFQGRHTPEWQSQCTAESSIRKMIVCTVKTLRQTQRMTKPGQRIRLLW